MADNENINIRGTNVASPIVPFTRLDTFPTHYAEFGKGGFRSVSTYDDLDNITIDRREEGMLVYCLETKYAYQWLNGSWVKSKIGGGVEKISDSIQDINPEDNPELYEEGNIVYSEEDQLYYYYLNNQWNEWGQLIHVGNTPPSSTSGLWVDTRRNYYAGGDPDELNSIWAAIQDLQEKLGILMTLKTSGVISGSVSDGTRTAIMNSAEPEKPRATVELEAESFDINFLENDLELITTASTIVETYTPIQSYLLVQKDNEGELAAGETLTKVKEKSLLYQELLDAAAPGFFAILSQCQISDPEIIQPAIDYAERYVSPAWDPNTDVVEPDTEIEPTVKHISIKMGTWEQLEGNIRNFVPGELIWCTNKAKLYIYINNKLVGISGSGSGNDDYGTDTMDELTVKQLIADKLNTIETLGFIPVGSDETSPKYLVRVDDYGRLIVYESGYDSENPAPTSNYYFADDGNYASREGVLINSFYLGGTDKDEHSYQPCSHNFIELGNVAMDGNGNWKEFNLNGFYLHYRGADGNTRSLKLWGKIPAGGTFLIRGAQCSVMDVNTTKIKVKNYDMEWYETELDQVGEDDNGLPIFKEVKTDLIKFDQTGASFYLSWCSQEAMSNSDDGKKLIYKFDDNTAPAYSSLPQTELDTLFNSGDKGQCSFGYLDLVGVAIDSFQDTLPHEGTLYKLPIGVASSEVIFRRWYLLDPTTQSNPKDGISKHNNVKYLTSTYLNGSNIDDEMDISEFTPRASWEGKSIATTRTLFSEKYPSTLTCTFGCQATDNTVVEKFWEETEAITTPNATLNNETLPDVDEYEIGNVIKLSNNKYYILKSSTPKGIGATRCFCWNSVGYYDEGIEIRKVGSIGFGLTRPWFKVESIKEGSNLELPHNISLIDDVETVMYPDFISVVDVETNTIVGGDIYEDINKVGSISKPFYNRVRWESAYGQPITTHRVIIRGLEAGDYEYRVYREGDESYTNKNERPRRFSIRTDADVIQNGFNFVQTTDQQGASWEEYEVWNLSARIIRKMNDMEIPEDPRTLPEWDENDPDCQETLEKYNYALEVKIPDYDFTINTGDICYNGSRSNEWIDYYNGYEPLNDKVEMLNVGNNDLAPTTMRDIGNGKESPFKIDVGVIDYFYTFEIDPLNPQLFIGKSDKDVTKPSKRYKMSSLYSFNYGKVHFISLLSEIRTISHKSEKNDETDNWGEKTLKKSTVNTMWGVKDERRQVNGSNVATASRIFDTEEEWVIRDLIKWKNGGQLPRMSETNYWTKEVQSATGTGYDPSWEYREKERYNPLIVNNCENCIVFTHEMPFNIISKSAYDEYQNSDTSATGSGPQVPRETAKAYLNRFHNFEYQRLFKTWGIRMVTGGHKHTCAITHPVYDAPLNYDPTSSSNVPNYETGTYTLLGDGTAFNYQASFCPFMQITKTDFISTWNTSNLKTWATEVYNNTGSSFTVTEGADSRTFAVGLNENTIGQGVKPRVRVEVVNTINAPAYVMCQATGFKNKSNSELADVDIPWEEHHVPRTDIRGQCYPFYNLYKVNTEGNDPKIVSKMYRIKNMYDDGGEDTGGSPAGYWDLVKIYSPNKTLQENRDDYVNRICKVELYNKVGSNTTGTVINLKK